MKTENNLLLMHPNPKSWPKKSYRQMTLDELIHQIDILNATISVQNKIILNRLNEIDELKLECERNRKELKGRK